MPAGRLKSEIGCAPATVIRAVMEMVHRCSTIVLANCRIE
jgi:hypothetical protein